jgi:hypothetical protein
MDETTKFRKLLDGYRDTYLQFVSTGSQQYKDASQTILGQIQATIDSRRQQHADETKVLGSFLDSYKTQQADLTSLESKSAQKLDDVHSIQNEYAATQERYDVLTSGGTTPETPAVLNYQRGYEIALRLGLLLVFTVGLFLVGYFFPSETLGMFAQQQQAVASAAAAASAAVAAVTPRPGAFGMASPSSPFFRPY